MSTTKLLTTAQAAEILGLKPNTLEIWRLQGKGPIFRKIGKFARYTESDLQAFIEGAARTSTSQKPHQLTAV